MRAPPSRSTGKNEQTPLRVVLVDDHQLVREGIRLLLERIDHVEVVGEASNGEAAAALLETVQTDVVLLDVTLPGMDGFQLLDTIVLTCPDVRTIVLSMHRDEAHVRQAVHRGAAGYVVKDSAVEELEFALGAIARGGLYLSPAVARYASGDPGARASTQSVAHLTPRQHEILIMIAKGFTSQGIGHELRISVKTVETHRSSMMTRLRIHDVAGLVRLAVREGLVTDD